MQISTKRTWISNLEQGNEHDVIIIRIISISINMFALVSVLCISHQYR